MWGCFQLPRYKALLSCVFPTHVGVFLFHELRLDLYRGLPHACGGVSFISTAYTPLYLSSPRMWGCFLAELTHMLRTLVFPTHVGVFLAQGPQSLGRVGLPHACGGVSSFARTFCGAFLSSPRMWGCFHHDAFVHADTSVFPTHVGVFLAPLEWLADRLGSSPRMWGCFPF